MTLVCAHMYGDIFAPLISAASLRSPFKGPVHPKPIKKIFCLMSNKFNCQQSFFRIKVRFINLLVLL